MKKRNLILSIASGLILACALPKPGMWFLAWIGLVPLLMAIRGADKTENTRRKIPPTLLYGLAAGIAYFGIILYWISLFGYLPWVGLVLVQSLFIAVFALAGTRLLPSRIGWMGYIAVPAAWTAMQWLRSLGAFSFTWGSLAHTQANNLDFTQIASVTGVWGLDFFVCLFNLALAELVFPTNGKRRYIPSAIVILLVGCIWINGYSTLHNNPIKNGTVKVAIIQGNLDQNVVPDLNYVASAFGSYAQMSLEAVKNKPDFIIWPETTLPLAITNSGWDAALSNLARSTYTNLIAGAYDSSDNPKIPLTHNAAHFYNRYGKKLGVYRKVHLVPYGEFVPLRDKLPFLKRYGVREQDVLAGKSHKLINTEIGKIGVNICFESLFPKISQMEAANGATALFILTNDAWFERTQTAQQHLMMAKLRAIENRRCVVRAAATGISAIIDPYGRTTTQLGIFKRGIVRGSITPSRTLTPYARFGDYFAYFCALITIISLAITFGRERPASAEKPNREI